MQKGKKKFVRPSSGSVGGSCTSHDTYPRCLQEIFITELFLFLPLCGYITSSVERFWTVRNLIQAKRKKLIFLSARALNQSGEVALHTDTIPRCLGKGKGLGLGCLGLGLGWGLGCLGLGLECLILQRRTVAEDKFSRKKTISKLCQLSKMWTLSFYILYIYYIYLLWVLSNLRKDSYGADEKSW